VLVLSDRAAEKLLDRIEVSVAGEKRAEITKED